jgi:hypothetical protein
MAFAGLGLLTFLTAARKLSVPLHSSPRLPRGITADAMAARDGREHSTMEGTGLHSGRVTNHLK